MFIFSVNKFFIMSYVISVRIRRELKELMDKVGVNWSEEIRRFLERRVREEMRRKFLDDAKRLRSRIGVESKVSAAELIREDRDHGH